MSVPTAIARPSTTIGGIAASPVILNRRANVYDRKPLTNPLTTGITNRSPIDPTGGDVVISSFHPDTADVSDSRIDSGDGTKPAIA